MLCWRFQALCKIGSHLPFYHAMQFCSNWSNNISSLCLAWCCRCSSHQSGEQICFKDLIVKHVSSFHPIILSSSSSCARCICNQLLSVRIPCRRPAPHLHWPAVPARRCVRGAVRRTWAKLSIYGGHPRRRRRPIIRRCLDAATIASRPCSDALMITGRCGILGLPRSGIPRHLAKTVTAELRKH